MVFPGLIMVLSIVLFFQIHHFLDFVKQIYKDLPKVVVSTSCIMFFFLQETTFILPFSLSKHICLTTASLCSLQARYFENPQVIAENTVPSPEMVGMITSVLVKTAPEREDSETRTVS